MSKIMRCPHCGANVKIEYEAGICPKCSAPVYADPRLNHNSCDYGACGHQEHNFEHYHTVTDTCETHAQPPVYRQPAYGQQKQPQNNQQAFNNRQPQNNQQAFNNQQPQNSQLFTSQQRTSSSHSSKAGLFAMIARLAVWIMLFYLLTRFFY